jgi:hypothetical protein
VQDAATMDAACLSGLARDIAGLYDQLSRAYFH